MRLRSELTVAVFEKSLRRKNTGVAVSEEEKVEGAEAGASVGKVITLVSEDTNRVLRMGCDSHLLYGSPLEIIVGLSLLYKFVSVSPLSSKRYSLTLSLLSSACWVGVLSSVSVYSCSLCQVSPLSRDEAQLEVTKLSPILPQSTTTSESSRYRSRAPASSRGTLDNLRYKSYSPQFELSNSPDGHKRSSNESR